MKTRTLQLLDARQRGLALATRVGNEQVAFRVRLMLAELRGRLVLPLPHQHVMQPVGNLAQVGLVAGARRGGGGHAGGGRRRRAAGRRRDK